MRLSPDTGKTDCHIIDFVDWTKRVPGVLSVPTLFGLDPSEVVDGRFEQVTVFSSLLHAIAGATIESLEEAARRNIDMAEMSSKPDTFDDVPDPTSVTYIDHDDPFSTAKQSHGAPHVITLSPNAWVGCGGDIYVLECMGKGHIRIEPSDLQDG